MDSLKVTFVNGEELSFAISSESTLSIETPDGVNGVQRGVVSEVVDVEYVKAVADAPAEVAVPDVATPVDAPVAPADEVTPAVEVTPDPPVAASAASAASSDTSATSSSTDSTSSDTTGEAATSRPVTEETPDQGDTAA